MKRLKKIPVLLVVLTTAALLNISCFDMYSEVWENSASERYRLALFQTTNTVSSNLLLLKSDNSMIQLSAPVVPTTGYSSAMGDFNNDGNVDYISISYDAPHRLFFTDGKGGIKYQYDFPNLNEHALDSAVIDFDRDGDLDIFVASESGQNKYLFLNNGNSTFTSTTPWPNTLDGLATVSAADFDNDNDIDFFVYDSNLGFVRLYKNDGTGSLSSFWLDTPPASVNDTAIADFDKDGDIDVIEVTFGDKVILLTNSGNGSFTQGWISSNNHTSLCVTVGDFDGDGDMDAYVGNQTSYNTILLNHGNGTFSEIDHTESINVNTADAVTGDIDLDGDIDIISGDAAGIRIYKNNGTGDFSDMLEFGAWPNTKSLSIGQIYK